MPLATTPLASGGHEIVRVLGSTPDDKLPLYYIALLSAIRNAKQRIWVSAAYFGPTHEELEDLRKAARRGVDVRLVLPSHSDCAKALAAGRSHYSDLLDAGVKIFEARDVILHAKSVTIDGVWSSIGSSNFDRRSVLFNDEVDVIVLGGTSGTRMEAIFDDDSSRPTASIRRHGASGRCRNGSTRSWRACSGSTGSRRAGSPAERVQRGSKRLPRKPSAKAMSRLTIGCSSTCRLIIFAELAPSVANRP
jgi:cardiolipin synthase